MKNILMIIGTAVLLFTLSAALSLYLTTLTPPAEKEKSSTKAERPSKETKEGKDKSDADSGPSPIAVVQQPPSKSAEEAASLLTRLREREAGLARREEEARRQEGRLQLIMDDIRGERAIIDNLRKQLTEELKRLNEKQASINRSSRNLEEQKAAAARLLEDMQKRQIEYEKNESRNFTQMASISDSMPPEKAAGVIQKLADTGQIDTAVKLLGQMKERRAAQVLAEMADVALAAQLMDKLRGLKRPTAAGP
jgi:flagellar motility protein MotE (MotC chaperone)